MTLKLENTPTGKMPEEKAEPIMDRRDFMKAGSAAGVAFAALAGSKAGAIGMGNAPFAQGYGPLQPTADKATGLELLALPEGFEYMSFGWTGQIMSDGLPTPTDHDGMAVVAKKGHIISLVRNHELSAGEGNKCEVLGGTYNSNEWGGTTNLLFDTQTGQFTDSWVSLGGTIRNCAGGLTPWGTWVSCEETFHAWGNRGDGFNHGYVFEVPGFGISDGQPIRDAGRFSHEAVAIDPKTGCMYETEDTGASGFYKYVPHEKGNLAGGGELFAMVVVDQNGVVLSRYNLRGSFPAGTQFKVAWQLVEDPEGMNGSAFSSAPDAAMISRGEGCWYDAGKIYFVSTDGGDAGLGQIYCYDPRWETVTLIYESVDENDLDGPDNIAVSPRGGIIMCEDGGSNPKRLVGLTQLGEVFTFAENRISLNGQDLAVIDSVYPGTAEFFHDGLPADGVSKRSFTSQEWCGATFYKDWLFVNVQSPGVTFAIRGPWNKGAL